MSASGTGVIAGPLEQSYRERSAAFRAASDSTRLTRTHWHIAIANGLGWGFDGMDGVIFALATPLVIKDSRCRPGRHAAAPGAIGLRAAGRQQLQGCGLWLAAQYRGAGESGRGARRGMKTVWDSNSSGPRASSGRSYPGPTRS